MLPTNLNNIRHSFGPNRRLSSLNSVVVPTSSVETLKSYAIPSDAQRRTIYALATPPGKGGVAVIRISGPDTLAVYERIVRPVSQSGHSRAKRKGKEKEFSVKEGDYKLPEPRKMIRCSVVDPVSGEELDDGLAVFFKGTYS